MDMSPREICAYLRYRQDVIEAKPEGQGDVDYDEDGAEGWGG